jgi:two-component system, LytTR family, sensor kinase
LRSPDFAPTISSAVGAEPGGAVASRSAARPAYATAWLVVACAYASLFLSMGASAPHALLGAAAVVAPNAALGLVSLRLARRWPWPDGDHPHGLLRASLAALAVAAAATAGWLLLALLDARLRLGQLQFPALAVILWQALINSLIQLALLGAGQAWSNGERAHEARARAQRAEALHARAELQLLRSQLNPHFVLNTLHALLGLVRRDPAAAEAAIERLGELLQFGMGVEQQKTDRVAFREEWAFVTRYLELEQLRFGARLLVEVLADPAAMDVPVPPFAIHPLVENAIAHGIAPRAGGGRLAICARRGQGRLRVDVTDDGPGASESAILASPRAGLRLLRERLTSLYGGHAELRFEAPEGGGLRAVLELPDGGAPEAP